MPKQTTKKSLNTDTISKRITELGLNQAEIAKKLSVSREIVSQWFKNIKFPRPRHLLHLAEMLDLAFDEIVIKEESQYEPIIAFRKKGRHKIDEEYEKSAKFKGEMLKKLVHFLDFETIFFPRHIENLKNDYEYIQRLVYNIRNELHCNVNDSIDFTYLIDFFKQQHAVIIPVLWGKKDKHENALHVFLPDSKTTWIYLNLDSNIIDFKFWMAHELGHIFTPDLRGDEAEEFADNFAGALLFPENLAKIEYEELSTLNNTGIIINHIKNLAEKYIVSPITIYMEIKKYAQNYNKHFIDLEKNNEIFQATANFNKDYLTVSELIFKTKNPSPHTYINKSTDAFDTPFFETLKQYIIENNSKSALIQNILDLSYLDSRGIFEELMDASN